MFTAARLVNLCIILLVTAAFVVGGYYAFVDNQRVLTDQLSAKHQSIAKGFETTTWKLHRDKMTRLYDLTPLQMEQNLDVAVFADDVLRYFDGMHIDYIQLYSPAGKMLLSLVVNKNDNPAPTLDKELFSRAFASGNLVTDISGNFTPQVIANSLYPITRDGKAELWVRIASDVTSEQHSFFSMLGIAAFVIVLLVVNMMLLNYFNTRRAEAIIARQYEDNADLLAQAASAKESNNQKSQFLANITHELRTPLNAIIGFSDILKNEFVPAPGQSKHTNYINDIHSSGTHLLSLINDILDYSKAEAGKLELEASEVNAIKMVQNCIRLVQPRAEIGQVRLEEALPKDQLTMITDSKKFKQIMLNLLSNAVKFTPPEGKVKVSAWVDMREDMCVFEVRDSGIGISPKDISRAMSPFGQVDNTLSRKYEGTGLGLPLTKKFVELMGGKFSIESQENVGTTVTFSLPRELKSREGVIVKNVV